MTESWCVCNAWKGSSHYQEWGYWVNFCCHAALQWPSSASRPGEASPIEQIKALLDAQGLHLSVWEQVLHNKGLFGLPKKGTMQPSSSGQEYTGSERSTLPFVVHSIEQLAEEHDDLIVIGNSIEAECFALETCCRSSECAHHVDTGFVQVLWAALE